MYQEKPLSTGESDMVSSSKKKGPLPTKKRKDGSSRGRNKPPGEPLRPLNSYTLFFLTERERILKGTDHLNLPFTEEEVAQISCWNQTKPKRAHRKTDGANNFHNLTDTIVKRWKKISPTDRQVFARQAKIERAMYVAKVQKWKKDISHQSQRATRSEELPCSLSELFARFEDAPKPGTREEQEQQYRNVQEQGPTTEQLNDHHVCSDRMAKTAKRSKETSRFLVPPLKNSGESSFSGCNDNDFAFDIRMQQEIWDSGDNQPSPLCPSLSGVIKRGRPLSHTTPVVDFTPSNGSTTDSSFCWPPRQQPELAFPRPLKTRCCSHIFSSSMDQNNRSGRSSLLRTRGSAFGAPSDIAAALPKVQQQAHQGIPTTLLRASVSNNNRFNHVTGLLDPLDPNEMDRLFV